MNPAVCQFAYINIIETNFLNNKICHLTSAHPRNDTRIFIKECRSLASAGYSVSIIVADGVGDETKNGLSIFDVGKSSGRIDRMINTTRRVLRKAIEVDADAYHFHDPELIPVGLKLKALGKCVIFDAHEDVPKQVLGKPYLGPMRLQFISYVFAAFERYTCKKFDGIVAATPFIRDKFLSINPNTVDINNFPLVNELSSAIPWKNKELEICYVGGIAQIRGIRESIQAMGLVQSSVKLNLCGKFSESDVEKSVRSLPGWMRITEYGFVDRVGVRDVLSRSIAGLVTFHPLPNHVDAQPNKMFEYMSARIPVIASDFPLWREIIEGNQCGLCVDPLKPEEIAKAIDYLITHPDEAFSMGENGRRAVLERYNWQVEEKKLLAFYENLLNKNKP